LQKELDSFVETDDIVRRNLDRKQKVDEIRSKVDTAIKSSQREVYRKSPRRYSNDRYGPSTSKSPHSNQQSHFTSMYG
jgi:hypothetical protein